MAPGAVDPQALGALNAHYAQRFQALWLAVQEAALPAPGAAGPFSSAGGIGWQAGQVQA